MIGLVPDAFGQFKTYRPPPNYVQIGKPDQAEGRRTIEAFRQSGLAGNLYLQFELRVLPRRGEGTAVPARLWTGRNEKGPISRVVLAPGDPANERRLLIQNGPESAIWSWSAGPSPAVMRLDVEALFDRLAGTDFTAFDLQMPFLFWNDFVFEGVARVRGRPANVFLLYPPPEISARRPDLTGVRVYLDSQFNALVQSEQIGPEGRLLKSFSVLDLKKVDDRWMVKSIDVRDEETRNKTRFAVTGAAAGLDLSPALFEPDTLADAVAPPPASRIRPVGP